MELKSGDKLGPYEIVSVIGAGGMGEVYKARDPRLERTVALKVSKAEFSQRFAREARTAAQLNHPNVCTLHDVGPNYLVMELIEGPTLADRIRQGPIPLEEALPIAKQIADALEAAHEQGIVHRDLKPANIKIRPGGSVKVLDFGLAKMDGEEAALTSDSPTLLSVSGVILGTAGYMAPEQARGLRVDKRADIWAFGVVLYEMVTGQRLFERATVSDTLAAVIKEEPDLTLAPEKTRRLLARCLEKDPKKRLRDIGDAMAWLEVGGIEVPGQVKGRPARWLIVAAVVLAAAVVSAGLAFRAMSGANGGALQTFAHLTMELAPAEMLGPPGFFNRPSRTAFAISPDGATVVFAGISDRNSRLFRRPLAESTAAAIAGTEGAEYPFFSPDGQWVGFEAMAFSVNGINYKLKKVALSGGPPIEICTLNDRILGASWGSAGVIVFSSGDLWTVPESGGIPTKLLDKAGHPFFLPDGKTVLFTTSGSGTNSEEPYVDSIQIATKQRKTLLTNATDPRYSPTGHLLFMRSGDLLAVPFDAGHAEVSGSPVPLISGIMQAINAPPSYEETWMGQFAVSSSGTLLYASGGINPAQSNTLVLVDRKGTETKLAAITGQVAGLHVSPDGARAVVGKTRDVSRASDLWTYEIPSGTATRLTSTGDSSFPLFSPDGKSITYYAPTGINSMPLNGSGTPIHIGESDPSRFAVSWSADGKWLAYLQRVGGVGQLFVRPMQNPGEPLHFSPSTFDLQSGEFSPDGRWIAYVSPEAGGPTEVYVEAFPGPGPKRRISSDGGTNPAWSRNGHELFYTRLNGNVAKYTLTMMAAEISDRDGSVVGALRTLFEGPYLITFPLRTYDVTPDGRFLMVRPGTPPDQTVTQLNVVLGWGEELKRRVPSSTPARWRAVSQRM